MRILCAVMSMALLTACGEPQQSAAAAKEAAPSPETITAAVPEQGAEQAEEATSHVANNRAAQFERTDPSRGTLVLEETGETFVLTLVAGGRPAGASTAADCAVTIEGPQDLEGMVRGRVVPSSGAYGDMTAADIGPTPLKIDVMIGPEGAFVTDHGAAAKLCGMGSQLDGFYKRLDTPD